MKVDTKEMAKKISRCRWFKLLQSGVGNNDLNGKDIIVSKVIDVSGARYKLIANIHYFETFARLTLRIQSLGSKESGTLVFLLTRGWHTYEFHEVLLWRYPPLPEDSMCKIFGELLKELSMRTGLLAI